MYDSGIACCKSLPLCNSRSTNFLTRCLDSAGGEKFYIEEQIDAMLRGRDILRHPGFDRY
jgi:hypothetical protein